MDASRREGFAGRLQRERAALLRRLAAATSVSSRAARREFGTPRAPCDRSRSTPTDGRTRQALEEIDAGLARLATDSYGICTTCGREIALERLELGAARALEYGPASRPAGVASHDKYGGGVTR